MVANNLIGWIDYLGLFGEDLKPGETTSNGAEKWIHGCYCAGWVKTKDKCGTYNTYYEYFTKHLVSQGVPNALAPTMARRMLQALGFNDVGGGTGWTLYLKNVCVCVTRKDD